MNIDKEIKYINEYLLKYKTFYKYKIPKTLYPIFIIGAPRCGSTLLYQSICHRYSIEYPNNMIARFWNNPAFGYVIYKHLFPEFSYKSSFTSTHGYSNLSPLEPHEFGYFYNRFFTNKISHYSGIDTKVDKGLKDTINYLIHISKNIWIYKNMTLGQKIPLIKSIFPNAKFIYVKRDVAYNTQSILEVRKKLYGSTKIWWSLMPKEIGKIKNLKDPYEQVVAQVFYINKQIEEDLNKLAVDDYTVIQYENFCKEPAKTLEKIPFLKKIAKRNTLHQKFPNRNKIKIDKITFQKLKKILKKYNS